MAQAKTVVDPAAVDSVAAPAKPQAAAKPVRLVRFWKGFNPNQPIRLPDGSSVTFGTESYVTTDERLIEQLKSVAQDYGILVSE